MGKMGERRFKTIKLLFKLVLLVQIYSHNKCEVEAAQNSTPKSCDECDGTSGLNNQISENKAVDNVLNRPNRPARLIPLRMLRGKEKNKTEIDDVANKRFYGPATSCEELLKIGYTRNGFYLVKGNATSNNSHVEIVDCLFKHPNGTKEVKEKRFGPVPLKTKGTKLHQRRSVEIFKMESYDEIHPERSKRPIRLLPPHILYGNEKNDTNKEENVPKPFYGPPNNCVELAKLGYTLNGYYLVNSSKSSSSIEIVLCRFQLPPGINETASEERLGFINLDKITGIMDQQQSMSGRKTRPVRLLPPRRKIEKEENKTAEQIVKRLNSNPTNCNDIGMLGYTLNGYYLVNSSESVGRFGVSFCQFKLPPGANRTSKEDKFGFINLLEKINETSNEIKKQSNNCKNPVVLIKEEAFGSSLCMESWDPYIRFKTCNSSKTEQQWAILKTKNNQHDYIRLCQRVKIEGVTALQNHCLVSGYEKLSPSAYEEISFLNNPTNPFFKKSKPNKEVMDVNLLRPPNGRDKRRAEWQMNSITHQLANVEYPKVCMTSRHADPRNEFALLLQCNNSESPNPQLPQNQRFYEIPVIDKNEEQLCSD